jgi:hypothetical protein
MTSASRDGPTTHGATQSQQLKVPGPGNPEETLAALAIELGKIAAHRNFVVSAEDKPQTDELSSPEGRTS